MNKSDISRIIEMAWEDRTPFDAIEAQFGFCLLYTSPSPRDS